MNSDFISHQLIKNESITEREYQTELVEKGLKQSSLLVLPTGTGKTIVNLRITAERLHKNPDSQVILLAPTKPLVEQHAETYKDLLDIPDEEITIFTGEIAPDGREKMWETNPRVIIGTPQVFENDLISQRINFKNISHITFDECHRATGEYSYVYIADKYKEQAENPLITGLSASPGDTKEDVLKICNNINVKSIEVISEDDDLIQPYIHQTKIEPIFIDIDDKVLEIRDGLQSEYKKRLKKLYNEDYVDSRSKTLSNYKLRQARNRIQRDIQKQNEDAYKYMSIWAEAMKINQAIRTIETQGTESFIQYFERLQKEARDEESSKAVQHLVSDRNITKIYNKANNHNKPFAKFETIKTELVNSVKINNDKALIFTKSRDTVETLIEYLNDDFNVEKLVGQTDKENSKGLSQKEQRNVIKRFDNDDVEVLVSTQVGEEGLDISEVNLVIFYEPAQKGIEYIQRAGRTGRSTEGRVLILIGNKTRDVGSYYKSKNIIDSVDDDLESLREIKELEEEIKNELQTKQTTLTESTLENEEQLQIKLDEKDEITIFADSRETKSSIVKDLDLDTEVNVEIENNLAVGDYVVGHNCAIERKTAEDFRDTIVENNRSLFGQMSELSDNYENGVLLLEGGLSELYGTSLPQNAIRGALSSIISDFGISVMESVNEKDSAQIIKNLAIKEQSNESKEINPHSKKHTDSVTDQQIYIVSSIESIGPVSAKNLLQEFGSISNIFAAEIDELTSVKGIGEETAKKIYSILRTQYNPINEE